jgi:F-type H+-transporting ATPase subunit gamma
MANLRALDKRRKSIKNIRKITRTMELIATARFKKAMDRAAAATDYTDRITAIVRDLARSGASVSHPLLEVREKASSAELMVLTSNRGLCGGYNGSVVRVALQRRAELADLTGKSSLQVSGKRGIAALKFRGVDIENTYTQFEDQPSFDAVSKIADDLIQRFVTGQIDRFDVAYTRFQSDTASSSSKEDYEFLPSAASILEEVVPASFRVRLFKCFLDAAVSEQIARMVAMKSATENAGDMIKQLSRTFNRARQAKITGEIMEIIGGVEALG